MKLKMVNKMNNIKNKYNLLIPLILIITVFLTILLINSNKVIIAETCDTQDSYSGVCNIGPRCGVGTKCENNPPCGSKSEVPSCNMKTTEGKTLNSYAWTQIRYIRTKIVCTGGYPSGENCICDVEGTTETKKVCYCYQTIQKAERICDTNDKLQTKTGLQKDGYLVPGIAQCTGDVCGDWVTAGTVFYKVCCTPDGKVGHSGPYFVQDPYQPPEGVCIGGSKDEIMSTFTSDPNSLPNPGEPHPDCTQAKISCNVSQIGSNTIRVVASTPLTNVENTIIRIRVSSLSGECKGTNTCTKDFSGTFSGTVIANSELIQNNIVLASTTCSTNIQSITPITPPSPPPTPPATGGICSPYLFAQISKNQNFTLAESGQSITYNTSSTPPIINKGENIFMDVQLKNAGLTLKATCNYYPCKKYKRNYKITCGDNSWYQCSWSWVCLPPSMGGNGCTCTPGSEDSTCGCDEWDYDNPKTETFYNYPNCSFCPSNNPDCQNNYINVGYRIPNEKIFKYLSDLSLFGVRSESTINNNSTYLDKFDRWGRDYTNQNPALLSPQRHGEYYIDITKTSGNIYNKPDKITAKDSNDRDYYSCSVETASGIYTDSDLNQNKSEYVLWDETHSNSSNIAKGTVPLNIPKAQIRFYVSPTDVQPFINIQKPEISHPSEIKTPKRDFIVGFPFNITFGVQKFGFFGKDKGKFWLDALPSSKYDINPQSGEEKSSALITPTEAGENTYCAIHNADDERISLINPDDFSEVIGNEERACSSITVYRYLCYQGFCYECPREPTKPINGNRLNEALCKVVEPAKCKAYIGSDCKSKGRE